jgi:simple sugar transport system ATP-binding protein
MNACHHPWSLRSMTANDFHNRAPRFNVSSAYLATTDIHLSFGAVKVLRGVDFQVARGEVVGLVGDNGAGKSTLIKVLAGVYRPDGGTMTIEGEPVEFHEPDHARKAGIETVYQDLSLVETLDVTANLFLGREHRVRGGLGRLGFMDKATMRTKARDDVAELRVNLPPVNTPVSNLSGGQRQAIAIARATSWGRTVVLMDEPTAALGVRESQEVLSLIRQLRDRGLGLVVISHDIPHVFEVADRIVVLRHGTVHLDVAVDETDSTEIVGTMLGAYQGANGENRAP